MMPIGPLMIEHRLIERMASLLEAGVGKEGGKAALDVSFIDHAVDFFRTYADRTHHGKEEDILFRELGRKDLSQEHARTMRELVEEHVRARESVGRLLEAEEAYLLGDPGAFEKVREIIAGLTRFYAAHIEKEDKRFFIPVMDYFSREEQDAMLEEFREFDRTMIHEKYLGMVEAYERGGRRTGREG